MAQEIEYFTQDIAEIDVILLLSNGTTVGFSSPESATRYIEILDLEDSGIEVVNSFNNSAKVAE